MSRLCIYVVYDADGIIDEYVGYMLREIKKHVTQLIVVCNFPTITSGKSYVDYADIIIFRENIGYDTGAWKDVLCKSLGWESVHKFDELILTNDSYYGPLYPLEEMFNTMENVKVDFWGPTCGPAGTWYDSGICFDEHIQSYFICIRKRMLQSDAFKEYWEKIAYPNSFADAVLKHEVVFTQYFKEKGFTYNSYMSCTESAIVCKWDENPFDTYNYELLLEVRCPFLKKKSLQFERDDFVRTLTAVQILSSKYPVNYIWDNIERLNKTGRFNSIFSYNKLRGIIEQNDDVYIYGAGNYGNRIASYLDHRGWHYKGFVVSNCEGNNRKIINVNDIKDFNGFGFIVAVIDKCQVDIIRNYLEKKGVPKSQIVIREDDYGR